MVECLNAQAANLLTGRSNDVAESLFHGALVPGGAHENVRR